MRNSNSPPPRYGAEGPPGGAEAWNRERFQQAQPKGGSGMFAPLLRRAAEGIGQHFGQQMQRPTAPDWSKAPRMQWGQQPQQPLQMSPGAPPPGASPTQNAPMPGGPQGMAPAQSQAQSSMMPGGPQMPPQGAQQGQPQMQQPQQGMAGLGQAARGLYDRARVNALRGRTQEQ